MVLKSLKVICWNGVTKAAVSSLIVSVAIICVSAYILLTVLTPNATNPPNPISFSTTESISPGRSNKTTLGNVLFGIAAGSEVWGFRKNYIKVWWRPESMRGFVWLDRLVDANGSDDNVTLPPLMVSGETSHFHYTFSSPVNKNEQKQQIRMARIVSEMFRLGLEDVHWFVMGDDDTIFYPDNLVKMLSKYDHNKFYYIGCTSESHLQNVQGFSTSMAYGGAGYAISYALAQELEKMQDGCIERYHYLYSGDARIHACLAELGVSLTKEPGFHQFDIHGDASGILGAHPLAPLLSLHHIDKIEPLFPNMDRVQALRHLSEATQVDPSGILQQSMCYNMEHNWSIKVSWGYAVEIMRGLVSPQDLEVPMRSFIGWHDDRNEIGFSFKTHTILADPCQQYVMFFMSNVTQVEEQGFSISSYGRHGEGACSSQDALAQLKWINVTKEPTRDSWYHTPRRQCCKITKLDSQFMQLQVANCKTGELSTITLPSSEREKEKERKHSQAPTELRSEAESYAK